MTSSLPLKTAVSIYTSWVLREALDSLSLLESVRNVLPQEEPSIFLPQAMTMFSIHVDNVSMVIVRFGSEKYLVLGNFYAWFLHLPPIVNALIFELTEEESCRACEGKTTSGAPALAPLSFPLGAPYQRCMVFLHAPGVYCCCTGLDTKCGGSVISRPTPGSSGAGELRTVAFNNSMHSFNDELPKPPWNPVDLSVNCGPSVSSFFTGSSVAS